MTVVPFGDLSGKKRAAIDLPPAVELAAAIAGGVTLAELAERHGCNPSTVAKRITHAGYSARTGLPTTYNPRSRARRPVGILGLLVQPWAALALCRQTDPEAFFPEKGGSTREAKAVCRSCDVRAECLDYALGNEERFGIWGGLSERERRKLSRRNQPAPPPTNREDTPA